MSEPSERHELSSNRARREQIVTGALGAAMSVVAFVAAIEQRHARDGSAMMVLFIGTVVLVGALALAFSAAAAPRVWASDEGIEIESKQGSVLVPWRHVSGLAESKWQRRPHRIAALNLRIDGGVERIRFVPCDRCAEWVEYFRAGA